MKCTFHILSYVIAILATITTSIAQNDFPAAFGHLVENRENLWLFTDVLQERGFTWRNLQEDAVQAAFSSMSNHVDEAVAMLPVVLTNDFQRELFLHMPGHAGTNALLRIWDSLLNISETNSVLCPPVLVDSFWCQRTTPLDQYVIFFYDLPVCQSLLIRTRNLLPEGTERRSYLDSVLSGAAATESRAYFIDSGEGLPPFLQGNE